MSAPDDIARGAIPREPGCHWCVHTAHLLDCDRCSCDTGAIQLGIDTALGG